MQELVGPYWTLRAALGPVLETLLLLDRLLFLQEQNNVLSQVVMVPLFDPVLSPRNVALIATKAWNNLWTERRSNNEDSVSLGFSFFFYLDLHLKLQTWYLALFTSEAVSPLNAKENAFCIQEEKRKMLPVMYRIIFPTSSARYSERPRPRPFLLISLSSICFSRFHNGTSHARNNFSKQANNLLELIVHVLSVFWLEHRCIHYFGLSVGVKRSIRIHIIWFLLSTNLLRRDFVSSSASRSRISFHTSRRIYNWGCFFVYIWSLLMIGTIFCWAFVLVPNNTQKI